MAEQQDTAADRSAAGTVADEAARLVEALGVWATSVSSPADAPPSPRTTPPGPFPGAPAYDARQPGPPEDGEPGPTSAGHATAAGDVRDDGAHCEHCGAATGVGRATSCQVCPVCQGIALLRTVRPETVDRLADLAGAVAATLRDLAAHGRTDTGPYDDAPHGRGQYAHVWNDHDDQDTAARDAGGPATVQDIPVDDGENTDEGDEL